MVNLKAFFPGGWWIAAWLVCAGLCGAAEQKKVTPEIIETARKNHWSFQPIADPKPPAVGNTDWVRNPIDQFVLARLEAAGLKPSPAADRRTLARRLSLGLTGLPLSPKESDAFAADDTPGAYPRLVDRLLDMEAYGQRWGRHWLDIARYSDTMGYVGDTADNRYPFAFTYRDYVIDAFNDDLPFNQFILEQLAADKLKGRPEGQAGLGYLTVGRRFINRIHEITDDRIDVVTRGLMGLTVTCARCHDHKYDPINMADYYGLYGVFRSSHEPSQLPLVREPKPSPAYDAYKKEAAKRQKTLDDYYADRRVAIEDEYRSRIGDYLLYQAQIDPRHKTGPVKPAGKRGAFRRSRLQFWHRHLRDRKLDADPVFGLWARLFRTPKAKFAPAAKKLLANPPAGTNKLILENLRKTQPKTMAQVAEAYGAVLESAHTAWKNSRKKNPKLAKLPDSILEQVRVALHSRTALTLEQARGMINQGERNHVRKLTRQINDLAISSPGAPPRAMVMVDADKPFEPRIFERGQPGRAADRVPRRFLRILENVDGGKAFADGSGRLELAKAIAHPKNPLTARVIVNRVWAWHFGKGLVDTPSDFGLRGSKPTHPQLLDWLATRFVAEGWSIKKLHHLILDSATYRQASLAREPHNTKDPSNQLLWRFNRRRLDFEQMRDGLLAVAGRLDARHGGRGVNLFKTPYPTRRAVYGIIDRQQLPGTLRVFDFASPDATTPKRPDTTVPQQALFMMNSPFVMEQAAHAVRRADLATLPPDKRIDRIYRLALGRPATADEIALGTRFVASMKNPEPVAAAKPDWQYGYGAVDQAGTKLAGFKTLKRFTSRGYHGGAKFPDAKLHYLLLNRTGGHVGADLKHAVVRRWISPVDGMVRIRGRLSHKDKQGDGVRASVIVQGGGKAGQWVAHNMATPTPVTPIKVRKGQIIDFVIDCRTGHGWDSFEWAPRIELLGPGSKATRTWAAAEAFAGPTGGPQKAPDAWAVYAQTILLSNAFTYVD